MNNPTMSLREFDAYMRDGNLKYSLLVISLLEESAIHIKHATKNDDHEEFGRAYDTQLSALETAEFEAKQGPIIEPVASYLKIVVEQDLQDTYTKWSKYLAKIGAHIEPFQFK